MTEKETEILLGAESEHDLDQTLSQVWGAWTEVGDFIDAVETAFDLEGVTVSKEVEEILGHLQEARQWLDDAHVNIDGMVTRMYEMHVKKNYPVIPK